MAKALVSVKDVHIDGDVLRLIYNVTVLGPPHSQYGSDHIIDATISLDKNLIALKERIANYGAEKGYRMSTGDVIIFGAPIVADLVSMKDETNGITSDVAAVAKEAVVKEAIVVASAEKGMWGKFVDNVKSMWSA
jgi:hypothetical protein